MAALKGPCSRFDIFSLHSSSLHAHLSWHPDCEAAEIAGVKLLKDRRVNASEMFKAVVRFKDVVLSHSSAAPSTALGFN